MKHIKKIKIDIDKKYFEVIPSVQYDSNTRFLHINLLNGSVPFNLTDCSVKISGTKPDGTAIFNNCTVINAKEGFIEVELTEQMNAAPGTVKCELKLYNGKGVLTTKQFEIEVTKSVTSKAITSGNEFKALEEALSKVNNIDTKFESLTEAAVKEATEKEIQKQIAIGNMANLTIAKGSITTEKYENGSITREKLDPSIKLEPEDNSIGPEKLNFVTAHRSENLFNKLAIDKNCYYSHVDGTRVERDPGVGTNMSELIPVKPSTNYIRFIDNVTKNCVVFYDKDKQYISGLGSSNKFLTPPNAEYVSIQVATRVLELEMLVEGEVKPNEYVPYWGRYVPDKKFKVSNDNMQDKSIGINKLDERIGTYVGTDEPSADKYSCWIKTVTTDSDEYPIEGHTHACYFKGVPDLDGDKYPNQGYGEDGNLLNVTLSNIRDGYLLFEGNQGLSMTTTQNLNNGYTIHMIFDPKISSNNNNNNANTYLRFMKQANINGVWHGLNVVTRAGKVNIDSGKNKYITFTAEGKICLSLVVSQQRIKGYVNGKLIGEIDSYDFSKMNHADTLFTIGYQFAEVDKVNQRFATMNFECLLVTENILDDSEVMKVYKYLNSTTSTKYGIFASNGEQWTEIKINNEEYNGSTDAHDINIEDCGEMYKGNNVEEALEEVKKQSNDNEKRATLTPDKLILSDPNGKEYRITINADGVLQATPTSVTPPPGFPGIIFEGESPYRGEFLVGVHAQRYNGKHFVFSLNHKGHLLRYKEVPDYAIDFKKTITKSGKVRYTYQQRIDPGDSFGHVEALGYNFAKFIVMNEEWEIIDTVTLKAHGNVPEGHPVDCHESLIIDDGHYILTAYHSRTIPNYNPDGSSAKVIQGVVQEIKDGKVLFHWESGDHLHTLADSYQDNYFTSSKYQEYLHLNAVWIDHRDNNLIISPRNLNALYKLNRKTGEIMWILGGKRDMFNLSESQKFSRQHAPVLLEDGSILLFNNGNDKGRSSIIEIKLDEKNKKVVKFKEHTWHKDDGNINFSPAMGNVNKLFSNKEVYAICWGVATNNPHYWCEEIDFDKGKSLCRFKLDNGHDIYRVHRYLE